MKNILIIGYGNFGKLLADKLSVNSNIFIYNRSPIKKIEVEFGGKKKNIKFYNENQEIKYDYVIFSVPVKSLDEISKVWKNKISCESIIIDVTSVKIEPLKILKKNFPKNKIVGTHPLFGPQSLRSKMKKPTVVICNVSGTQKDISLIKNLFKKVGFLIHETTAEEHDLEMANMQALSHFVGKTLTKFSLQDGGVFSTNTYSKIFQLHENIKDDSEDLFDTIQNYNPHAKNVRKQFLKHALKIDKDLLKKGKIK